MTEEKKQNHRNRPKRISDAEIMVVLILFHSSGLPLLQALLKEYMCKHLKHLFSHIVSYSRFLELEKF